MKCFTVVLLAQMKASSLASNRPKFKTDVLHAERITDPDADLTVLTRLLEGETLEAHKSTAASKYADIFPSAKQDKLSMGISLAGKTRGGRAGSAKFNFPSSRIISSASNKPLSKVSPLPNDPSKKYKCTFCGYSADRVNVISSHMKYCNAKKSPQNVAAKPSASTILTTCVKATACQERTSVSETPVTSPSLATGSLDARSTTVSAGTQQVKRKSGRISRGSKTVTSPVPVSTYSSMSSVKVASSSNSVTPRKRGRRSRKDKLVSEKQKTEILNDWNDSSSDGENDSDDEMSMLPSKPPELFLFGSEKNKKRKADIPGVRVDDDVGVAENEMVDMVSELGVTSGSGLDGKNPAPDDDQPPVLKKPRTDKELSDAFEALLKNTKPEYGSLLERDAQIQELDPEHMQVEKDNNQMSDIEHDALIVMKKTGNQVVVPTPVTNEGNDKTVFKDSAIEEDSMRNKANNVECVSGVNQENDETPRGRRSTRRQTLPQGRYHTGKASVGVKSAPKTETLPVTQNETPEKTSRKMSENMSKSEEKKAKERKKDEAPGATVGTKGRGRRGREPSIVEEHNEKTEHDGKEVETAIPSTLVQMPVTTSASGDSTVDEGFRARPKINESKLRDVQIKIPTPPSLSKTEFADGSGISVVETEKVAVISTVTSTLTSKRCLRGTRAVSPACGNLEERRKVVKGTRNELTDTQCEDPEATDQLIASDNDTTSTMVVVEENKTELVAKFCSEVEENRNQDSISMGSGDPSKALTDSAKATADDLSSSLQEKKVAIARVEETGIVAPIKEMAADKSPTKSVPMCENDKKKGTCDRTTSAAVSPMLPETTVITPATSSQDAREHVADQPSFNVNTADTNVIDSFARGESPLKFTTLEKAIKQPLPLPPQIAAIQPKSPKCVSKRKSQPPGSPTKRLAKVKVANVHAAEQGLTEPSIKQPLPVPLVSSISHTATLNSVTAPQKKPTAAVRPLVDTKEPKGNPHATSVLAKAVAAVISPSAKIAKSLVPVTAPEKDSPIDGHQTAGLDQIHSSQQETSHQSISVDGGTDISGDDKKSPALVAQRVVHLVPVENADGSITYMLLSLENGADNPAVLLEQGTEQAGTVLRLDKVEPIDGVQASTPTVNLPINPNEVEGIFLDKTVDNANQIVSALAAPTSDTPGTTTASPVRMKILTRL